MQKKIQVYKEQTLFVAIMDFFFTKHELFFLNTIKCISKNMRKKNISVKEHNETLQ
jgi:hypothetical protein